MELYWNNLVIVGCLYSTLSSAYGLSFQSQFYSLFLRDL